MGNYIKLFNNISAQTEFRNSENYIESHVSCVKGGTNVKYNKRYEDFDLVVDYAQGENDNYAIVKSKEDIHILSKESDSYTYVVGNDCSILPSNVNEGQIINVRILNYHGKTVDLSLEFWNTGSVEVYAWDTISYENNTDYVIVYAFDDGVMCLNTCIGEIIPFDNKHKQRRKNTKL